MRAVNLIPTNSGHGAGGRSGTGAFALLGVLALLVAGTTSYVLTHNAVVEHRAELAALTTQAQAVQEQVATTRPYREFAALAQTRIQTVRQLGKSRFAWQRSLADFAKVVPSNVWVTSMLGTVANGVTVEGAGSGTTGTIRTALPNPAIELTGCTTSQQSVARMISRLRLMRGVQRVALADSSKDGASNGGGGGSGCQHGDIHIPQFDLVIFFDPIAGLATSATTAVAVTTSDSSTPPASGDASTGSSVR